MKPNKALLKRTLRCIEEHPKKWIQAYYRCGSALCFAGHAAILSGAKWEEDDSYFVAATRSLPSEHLADRAQRTLRLTDEQTEKLFHSENTLYDLRRIVKGLCAT